MNRRGMLLAALLVALLAVAALAPAAAMAEGTEDVKIDETNFPDDTFRYYVKNNCDKNRDGYLSEEEIKAVTKIDVPKTLTKDLTGIEYITELKTLDCSSSYLTELDLSKNTALMDLDCSNSFLTTLDVSGCTALTDLDCSNNALTALDLSQNTELQNLNCSGQSVRLEVVRGADETWSADLAALVTGWKEHFETITVSPEEVWDQQTDTVAWSKGTVQPVVAYNYDTGFEDPYTHSPVKMDVTLTLVPLGVGTEADVTAAAVKGLPGVISGTEITVTLPAGSQLPTAGDIVLTLSRYASATAPVSTDGGRTWTFTVTSEDGQTVKNYTLYMAYDVTVENEDGHGTVTATPNPAQEGDTVTLIVTPDPGYVLAGWEVVLGDVTVGADNTFVMPAGPVILRAIFAPATTATPPQTGDDSHTGLWLALLLVSLGGLCAAAYAVRRRRAR